MSYGSASVSKKHLVPLTIGVMVGLEASKPKLERMSNAYFL